MSGLGDESLLSLKGVGPVLARRLKESGVEDLASLLMNFPTRYRELHYVDRLDEPLIGLDVDLLCEVEQARAQWLRGGRNFVRVRLHPVADPPQSIEVLLFGRAFLARNLESGRRLRLSGRLLEKGKKGWVLESPALEFQDREEEPGFRLSPVHPSLGGLSPLRIRRLIGQILDREGEHPSVAETRSADFLTEQGMLALPRAVRELHRPTGTVADLEPARRRLALEEARVLLAEVHRRRRLRAQRPAVPIPVSPELDRRIRARLPFTLSPEQDTCVREILGDMACKTPMARLLQGDVGTGKTLVAAYACLACAAAGMKALFLAPTELLAEQHAHRLSAWLSGSRLPVHLLTSSQPVRAQREIKALLSTESPCLVVGTHSLLQDDLEIRKLGLFVIDEQQRFGVQQRASLFREREGAWPHALVMSATPIPRTLATALFGDLDSSEIHQPPLPRAPVHTRLLPREAWPELRREIAAEVESGGRVFVVCPRIGEEDEEGTAESRIEGAHATWQDLSRVTAAEIVHGQMKPEARRRAQLAFREGRCGCLVGTTVLEVGIDVPEATWMVVRDADRLGLSTLHQLRGRVGRGDREARCFLLGDPDSERLAALEQCQDGFAIAEMDLRHRGAGELNGRLQHGHSRFRCLDIFEDLDLLRLAGRKEG